MLFRFFYNIACEVFFLVLRSAALVLDVPAAGHQQSADRLRGPRLRQRGVLAGGLRDRRDHHGRGNRNAVVQRFPGPRGGSHPVHDRNSVHDRHFAHVGRQVVRPRRRRGGRIRTVLQRRRRWR